MHKCDAVELPSGSACLTHEDAAAFVVLNKASFVRNFCLDLKTVKCDIASAYCVFIRGVSVRSNEQDIRFEIFSLFFNEVLCAASQGIHS